MAGKDKGPRTTAPGRRAARLAPSERRAMILTTATALFAELGYERCRMADVAARLGVTEPLIFQYFKTKAALFAAVIDQAADDMCTALRTEMDATGSAVAVVRKMLAPGHIDALHAPGSPGVLFADAIAFTAEPGVEEAARRGFHRLAEALSDVLRAGDGDGEVRSGIDPATGAWWLLSLMASHRFRSITTPDHAHRETELAALTLRVLITNPLHGDEPPRPRRTTSRQASDHAADETLWP